MSDVNRLYQLIKQFRLHWRRPELERVLKRIERGRLRPEQARRWLKRIKPWVEEQERCPNPFPMAPGQDVLGVFDIELGNLCEREDEVRIGIRLLDRSRHVLIAGATGSGKSNTLRRIFVGIDSINRNGDRLHHGPRP